MNDTTVPSLFSLLLFMAHSQMEASTEKEQLTNIYNLDEKDIVIMCFILCNCVNRLSKAQKNGSRWMNSTLLTLTLYAISVRHLHEGSVKKQV